MRHALDELESLDPQADEEAALAAQRRLLMNGEALAEVLGNALQVLSGGEGLVSGIAGAERALVRAGEMADGRLDAVLDVLGRAASEAAEAEAALATAARELAPRCRAARGRGGAPVRAPRRRPQAPDPGRGPARCPR